jgi:hypothetical protein
MQLELSAEELAVLQEVLDKALRDLREEVYKAEVADYKRNLKEREHVLVHLLERVQPRPTPT